MIIPPLQVRNVWPGLNNLTKVVQLVREVVKIQSQFCLSPKLKIYIHTAFLVVLERTTIYWILLFFQATAQLQVITYNLTT